MTIYYNMHRFSYFSIQSFSQWNQKDYDDYDGKVDYWNFSIMLENCSLFNSPSKSIPPKSYLFR